MTDGVILVKLIIVYDSILFSLHKVSVVSCHVSENGYVHMVKDIPTPVKDYLPILCS